MYRGQRVIALVEHCLQIAEDAAVSLHMVCISERAADALFDLRNPDVPLTSRSANRLGLDFSESSVATSVG